MLHYIFVQGDQKKNATQISSYNFFLVIPKTSIFFTLIEQSLGQNQNKFQECRIKIANLAAVFQMNPIFTFLKKI